MKKGVSSLPASLRWQREPRFHIFIARGEGELTGPDLLRALKGGKDLSHVAGISYRCADGAVCHNPGRQRIRDLDGIAKVNIGTEVRQAYEAGLRRSESVKEAQEATYERTKWVICDYFGQAGTRRLVLGEA